MHLPHAGLCKVYASAWILLLTCTAVWAHMDIEPKMTLPNRWETFVVSVPTETDTPTVEVQLMIPEGFEVEAVGHRPDWDMAIQRNQQGIVRAIVWSGGQIPPLTFEEFKILAKVPKGPGSYEWQARQRYSGEQDSAWTLRTIVQEGGSGVPTQRAEEALKTAQVAMTVSLLAVGIATVLIVVTLVAIWQGGRGKRRPAE